MIIDSSKDYGTGRVICIILQALEILDNACDTGNALEIGKAQVKARSLVVKATNVKV